MLEYINLVESDDELKEMEMRPAPDDCRATLRAVFPDMCPVFLEKTAILNKLDAGQAVEYVLDLPSYDKAPHGGKRKRSPTPKSLTPPPQDQVAKLTAIYDAPHRCLEPKGSTYCGYAKKLLSHEFPRVKVDDIKGLMSENGNVLFATHRALVKIQEDWQAGRSTRVGMKKSLTAADPRYDRRTIQATLRKESDPIKIELLQELVASRIVLDAENRARESEKGARLAEEKKMSQARATGNIADCECCCSEFVTDEMVFCNGDLVHFFCVNCARTNAENVLGLNRHELKCMSTVGCSGGFSVSQRERFLPEKLSEALDYLEWSEAVGAAKITNLESCPFCPFAAEYPSIQQDKEFRCGSDKCGIVSCRLCKQETHVPKSCEEVSKEKGMSARRQIEEAMSAAMIRKCNKCGTPFIKELGCNKMTCTRGSCRNVQCYVCSKSCAYDHFDDESRGGKKGNCPLFDDIEKRHEEEVEKAREVAQKKLAAEDPDINQEHLRINMSEVVAQDDERRRAAAQGRAPNPPQRHGRAAGRQMPVPVPQERIAFANALMRGPQWPHAQAHPPRPAQVQSPLAAQPLRVDARNPVMPVPGMQSFQPAQPPQPLQPMQPMPGLYVNAPGGGVSRVHQDMFDWNNPMQAWQGIFLNPVPPGHAELLGMAGGIPGVGLPFYDVHQGQAAPIAAFSPAVHPRRRQPQAAAPNPIHGQRPWVPEPPF